MSDQKLLDELHEILKLPGNNVCADCKVEGCKWASFTLGVFLCETCAKFHRAMGASVSRIMSVEAPGWTEDQVQKMKQVGNLRAQKKYEAFVPVFYKKPTSADPVVLREEWVRAKYQRQEFVNEDSQKRPYELGSTEGYLWKRGKDRKKFEQRKFVLSEQTNSLVYFNKEKAKHPKATIPLDNLNIAFVPIKLGNNNGIQLTYEVEDSTRSLFLYAEQGQEIVEWYNAIRGAKLRRRLIAFPYPDVTAEQLAVDLTVDFAIEGWVNKTGPRPTDAWRRRWMVLQGRKLMYFSDSLDAFAKGELMVGVAEHGYKVFKGVPPERAALQECFTLHTPTRDYHFSCAERAEKEAWVAALKHLLERPLTPQEQHKMSFGRKK